ncbi:UbiA family prenyltransferase [Saccharothrix syringae]|uniref:Prenyltransferase n=1 Tax=Saccharothrix syringae TaxID=103733 RepID=A0A5Q0H3I5_SACSY|nr:UbiA family prenyltransferase [Saccharothrix syringae]QFZ20669.1 hypothetical protein EKG83_27635 [Saccharothrix syringae]
MTTARTAAPTTVGSRIATYLRLGKARIYHHVYGWVLAALLLVRDGPVSARQLLALALLLVMVLATQWSAAAADDIGGHRDGSDARNYAGRPPLTVVKKPLVTGALTEREAVRFAVWTWIVGVAAGIAAAVLVSAPPLAVAVLLVAQVVAVQYSLGLKLSYRPLGLEGTILFTIACTALAPYWIAAGRVEPEILLMSLLVGLWFLLVVSYGNASDRAGDAEVGRRTMAVTLPPTAFAAVLHLFCLASAGTLALLFTTTRFSPVLAFTAVPVVVLHVFQLYYGVYRRELRKARFMGLLTVDLGCLGLVAALLAA